MNRDDQTSLISITSSEHGRLRRVERDIRKRDLQKALKYGKMEKAWGGRYKVTYDGIIFISSATLRLEITSFPEPMQHAPLEFNARAEHDKAKTVIGRKPDICTSHTVLVIDTSGSMKEKDIRLHRDRQVAAFSMVALEYVAEQLFNETANNRDVVSLVEFNRTSRVVFEREPVSWCLFNKLLDRRGLERRYVNRMSDRVNDAVLCDSNYLPALDEAERLFKVGNHDDCALSLFFLSDGRPTDARSLKLTPDAAIRRMCERMTSMATQYEDQISILLVGFGSESSDFSTLEQMAEAANKDTELVSPAKFVYCEKLARSVGTAVTSLVQSTTLTRTVLMSGERRGKNNTRTDIESETELKMKEWKWYPIISHYVHDPRTNGWAPFKDFPPGCLSKQNLVEANKILSSGKLPLFLAMNKYHCGTGAERVAYRCNLSFRQSIDSFALGAMVAKETIRKDRIEENRDFHKTFCETQSLASHLAAAFNQKIRSVPGFCPATTPKISFLKCSVLVLADEVWPGGTRGVLVEKYLDLECFNWQKWNDNAGKVEGNAVHRPMDVDQELARLNEMTVAEQEEDLFAIEEESEEDSDEDDEDDMDEEHVIDPIENEEPESPSDILQAFSHFSYLFTNRKLLVCDLQGVLNTDMTPPMFELSDPAVHYRSTKKRSCVMGRTDKGEKGIQLFFNTHKCNKYCKILQLSAKNKGWKKEWHRDFAKDMEQNFGTYE
mmetsp:Transcript_41571/g.99641  ORF Transcript_41571/g.99641 Transcript_41571/m.99641 type:complete len:722 (-) Transcript_41571:140-2305(-)|eukprot:CAMPEP_0113448336 /NCGR_PEP_ID=MMETSP0014_2-20120614/4714_1 /TAXON_ID=2857 /ORGANISM="Nitzschia sp." /LENGTH=721 /DNA_ID=CAMNT_0000339545 /DNA_START=372 /DNA_END=2537 /DNA_ORIENTATION=- /assembly_acc=CAM_ASM_000159